MNPMVAISLCATMAVSGLAWVLPLVAAAVGLAIWSYRRTTRPLSQPRKRILLALRIGVVAGVAMLLLDPVSRTHRIEHIPSQLLIALDQSDSMARKDVGRSGKQVARFEAAIDALRDADDSLDALAEQVDLRLLRFAGTAGRCVPYSRDALESLADRTNGRATAIGDSVQSAVAGLRDPQQAIAGVVLISDGCNNRSLRMTPEQMARRLASQSIRLDTVRVGSAVAQGASRELTVTHLGAPAETNAFSRLQIKPTIRTVGLAGQQVLITYRLGTEQIGQQTVKVAAAEQVLSASLPYVPTQVGYHRLTVSAKLAGTTGPTPTTAGQPRKSQLLHVTDRGIRVLYLAGGFDNEVKFITRAIQSFHRCTLDRRIILDARAAASLGDTLDDWLKYHVILLGNLPAGSLSDAQQKCIVDCVREYGKGLGMLGGENSFASGQWANTPLAAILPVGVPAGAKPLADDVRCALTADGEIAELTQLDSAGPKNTTAWASLDVLPGANRLGNIKPAATVLLATDDDALLVVQPVGKGRTLAAAFDSTWRWVMTPKDTAHLQRRFWRQVVLYLAAPKGNLWIHTERATIDLDLLRAGKQHISVTAGCENAQGLSQPNTPIVVTLAGPGTPVHTMPMTRTGRHWTASLEGLTALGEYTLTAKATLGKQTLQSEHRFELIERDLETQRILADAAQMDRLALQTGGESITLDGLPTLLEKLARTCQPTPVKRTTSRNLLSTWRWPTAVLLLALLSTEWFLRKKWGLV